MSLQDLKSYRVVVTKSVQVNFRNFKLTSCGAPSSETTVLQVMNVVAGYQEFGNSAMTNLSTHRQNEAIKFDYGAIKSSILTLVVELSRSL